VSLSHAGGVAGRILFFSGGTALGDVSRILTGYTDRSIHLVTPFDSGGSSAKLRAAFSMISVGDLRNRLMALADTNRPGHFEVQRLLGHRFPADGDGSRLRHELGLLTAGGVPMVDAVPAATRRSICHYLGVLATLAPPDFDLRGASIGNLVLTGGYLDHGRNIDAITLSLARLLGARGLVRPIVDADLHLRARLADGRVVVGQHRLTGKEAEPIPAPIEELELVRAIDPGRAVEVEIDEKTADLISSAELICYPMGSFYTSLVACLLPRGVGRAVAGAGCPKVYVPSCGVDPEQLGLTPAGAVERLLSYLRRDAGPEPADRLVDMVIVDSRRGEYAGGLDVRWIEKLGVRVLDVPLVTEGSAPYIDAHRLVDVLISLA
jgi:CofD-related protein of GAK system